MSNKELAEMKALCDAATPGPWKTDVYYVVGQVKEGRPGGEVIVECHTTAHSIAAKVNHIANARSIAAARTDLPRLIEEVERLRTEVERLQKYDPAVRYTFPVKG